MDQQQPVVAEVCWHGEEGLCWRCRYTADYISRLRIDWWLSAVLIGGFLIGYWLSHT
jgi:hypothetical protein